MNRATLIGRLGRDPELRYTQGGQAVANVSVATSERWKGKDGEAQERTEWHRIVAWGAQAEFCGNHLRKGDLVLVEGRIQTREWDDAKSGEKRRVTEIQATTVQALEPKGAREARSGGESAGSRVREESNRSQEIPPQPPENDIPF